MAEAQGNRRSAVDPQGQRALITGITGFIGSQLATRLAAENVGVIGLARSPERARQRSRELQHENIQLVYGDLQDRELLHRLVAEHKPGTVFHLGADALVSQEDDPSRYRINETGTRNLLDAIVSTSPGSALLFTSTAAVYETGSGTGKVNEDTPTSPRNDYARSKLDTEMLLRDYISRHGVSAGVARLTNVYGAGDLNFSRLIPGTMRSILTGQNPVLRSDGSSQHDFVYIEDAIGALTAIMSQLRSGHLIGEIFNVATGRNYRAIEVVEEIMTLADSEGLVIETGPPPHQQQVQREVSALKAEQLLGWKAGTALRDGLANTLEWYQYLTPELTRSGWT